MARIYNLRWAAVAASVVLLLGIGLWLRSKPIQVFAPHGETLIAQLPDGSSVELNSGSLLSYDRNFGRKHRRLHLEGEGFFEVKKASEPFTVETFNARTTVLGTRFDVRARPNDLDPHTFVYVASGTVSLSANQALESPVLLTSGLFSHVSTFSPLPSSPDTLSFDHALAWRSGGFAFQNRPLGMLLDEISRRFDVEIRADDELRSRPFAFWKRAAGSAESLLDDVTRASGLRFQRIPSGFEVYRP